MSKRIVNVHIGTSCLTRDLVWCDGCGRGLSLSGKWLHCPTCGNQIDQDSYAAAVEQALKNGANIYRLAGSSAEELLSEMKREKEVAEAGLVTAIEALKHLRNLEAGTFPLSAYWGICDNALRKIEQPQTQKYDCGHDKEDRGTVESGAMCRWELGLRNIVSILLGPRAQFDIKDVVEKVRSLAQIEQPQPEVKL